jgi:hypothetical protein
MASRCRQSRVPANRRVWRDASRMAHVGVDNLTCERRQTSNPMFSMRQGQAIMARLTKLSPDNAVWKRDLAWFDRQLKELAP